VKITETELPGIFHLQPDIKSDERGLFVKTVAADFFKAQNWRADFRESYYSTSHENVLRGMHFQIPPAAGPKFVCCVTGHVRDALLDLRKSSPTFGRHVLIPLQGECVDMIYMPGGIAHGFWVEQGPSLMLYYQAASYAPACDKGIAWDKAGINWPFKKPPIVSARDAGFPALAQFESPFG